LTVISLILRNIELYTDDNPSDSESEDDENEEEGSAKALKPGGNLIICPASLVKQGEHEIHTRVKGSNSLSVNVFHGSNRTAKVRVLAKYDVVLTSYQLVASEFKIDGILFKIK
jgi:transcription termination factor 2